MANKRKAPDCGNNIEQTTAKSGPTSKNPWICEHKFVALPVASLRDKVFALQAHQHNHTNSTDCVAVPKADNDTHSESGPPVQAEPSEQELAACDQLLEILRESTGSENAQKTAQLWQSLQSSPNIAQIVSRFITSGDNTESYLSAVVGVVVTRALPLHITRSLLTNAVLPRIHDLKGPASRVLMATVVHVADVHPTAVIDALILPVLLNVQTAGAPQCEIVTRLFRQTAVAQHTSLFLEQFSQATTKWNDTIAAVLQGIVCLKQTLSQAAISAFVVALERCGQTMTNSPKFASLLFQFVSKYTEQVKPHVELLSLTASRCSNFMAKSALKTLASC